MNPGIRTSLTAVRHEIVPIAAVIVAESTEDVAPGIAGYFMALPGGKCGRGDWRVPLETDRILLIVGWGNFPGQIVSPVNFHHLGVGLAVGNGHSYWLTFVIGVSATENPQ